MKRLFSILLCAAMLIGLLPTVALAEGPTAVTDTVSFQVRTSNGASGTVSYRFGDTGDFTPVTLNNGAASVSVPENETTITVKAIPTDGFTINQSSSGIWIDGQKSGTLFNFSELKNGGYKYDLAQNEGKSPQFQIEFDNNDGTQQPGGGDDNDNPPALNNGDVNFRLTEGGTVYYSINNTDWVKLTENGVVSSDKFSGATTIYVKAEPNEGYKLDDYVDQETKLSANQVRVDGQASSLTFTNDVASFSYSAGSKYEVEVRFMESNPNTGDGGSGDPQPGGTFTPGIRINDRGVTPTVEGAASPQNDGNYTFDENAVGATVTFTDSENRVKGLAVRVFDSNGLVSSKWLQQTTYTIDDVNKFYEIEVIDYNAIFDNQYRADYDNSDSKTVKVGDVTLDRDNTQTFTTGEPIVFTASAEPYKVIVRPNDDRNVELEITGPTFTYTPATDAGFELKVYWSKDEYDYDQFQGTDTLPIVVEYTKDSDTELTLSGAEIASVDKVTCGNNTKVRVASDVTSLIFGWGENTPKRLSVEGEEVNLSDTTSYTLNLNQDKSFYRLEFRWNDDPEPTWTSVIWGTDYDDARVENGTVLVNSIKIGETIYRDLTDPESDDYKKVTAQDGYDPLMEVGVSYYQDSAESGVWIDNGKLDEVGIENVFITFVFKPDYGYQVTDVKSNGQSVLENFTAGETVSTFTLPFGMLHFSVEFTETQDDIQVDSNQVTGASIANGQNAADSGNLKLTVADLDEDRVSDGLKAQAGESALYLDMNLYQVVSKGGENGNWENQLQNLSGTIAVTLKVPAPAEGSSYYIIREHGDGADRTYSRITVAFVPDADDPTMGTVTFETDKFSNYALAQMVENVTPSTDVTGVTAGKVSGAAIDTNTAWVDALPEVYASATEVKLTVTDSTASDETKNALSEKAGGDVDPGKSFYLDLTMTATVRGTETSITELRQPVTVTLTVPEILASEKYAVVREHGTEYTALPCTYDRTTSTLTVQSDKFSTYAIFVIPATADFTAEDNGVAALELLNAAKTGSDESEWDSTTKTLTLKGVNFTTSAAIAVKLPANTTIVLADGTVNTIASMSSNDSGQSSSYGISANGNLTIKGETAGTGTLTATGGEAGSKSYGIYAYNDVTISSGTVTATGGTAEYGSYGIEAHAGSITISGGTVTATGGKANSISYGIDAHNYVTISGGHVTAQAPTGMALNAAPDLSTYEKYFWRTATADAFTASTTPYTYSGTHTYLEIADTEITYQPTVTPTENGTVTLSPQNPVAGDKVTITTKPDEGYAVNQVIVTDASGSSLEVTDNGDGTYSFTQPAGKVTIQVTFKDATVVPFVDVPADEYYYNAVQWAVRKGITNGTSATTFSPKDPCTRAQMVTFLWRAAGCPTPQGSEVPFTDVVAGSFYEKAVLWAVENEITNGTSATTFSPDAICSRAQFATFLWRFQGKPAAGAEHPFTDVEEGAYYTDAVLWAAENNITKGTSDTTFGPDKDCSRAETVTFLYRCLGE